MSIHLGIPQLSPRHPFSLRCSTRSHTATIDLTSDGDKTALTYRVFSDPTIPVPGRIWAVAIRPLFVLLSHSFAAEARRRVAATQEGR